LQLDLLRVQALDGGVGAALDLDDDDAQIVFGLAREFDLAASFENDSSIKAIARAFERGVSAHRRISRSSAVTSREVLLSASQSQIKTIISWMS
jgi:hypothetical protein